MISGFVLINNIVDVRLSITLSRSKTKNMYVLRNCLAKLN